MCYYTLIQDLMSTEVLDSITLHSIKTPSFLYLLHNFLNTIKIMELRQKVTVYENEKDTNPKECT